MANMNQKPQRQENRQEKTTTGRPSETEKRSSTENMGNKRGEDVQKDRSERFSDDESSAV